MSLLEEKETGSDRKPARDNGATWYLKFSNSSTFLAVCCVRKELTHSGWVKAHLLGMWDWGYGGGNNGMKHWEYLPTQPLGKGCRKRQWGHKEHEATMFCGLRREISPLRNREETYAYCTWQQNKRRTDRQPS